MATHLKKIDDEIAQHKARIREKKLALKRSVEGLDESVRQLGNEARTEVNERIESVQNTFSVPNQVRSHPSAAVLGAFCVGIAAAFVLPGRGMTRVGRLSRVGRSLPRSYLPSALGTTLMVSAYDVLREAARSRAPSNVQPIVSRFFDRLRNDLNLPRDAMPLGPKTFDQGKSPVGSGAEVYRQ